MAHVPEKMLIHIRDLLAAILCFLLIASAIKCTRFFLQLFYNWSKTSDEESFLEGATAVFNNASTAEPREIISVSPTATGYSLQRKNIHLLRLPSTSEEPQQIIPLDRSPSSVSTNRQSPSPKQQNQSDQLSSHVHIVEIQV